MISTPTQVTIAVIDTFLTRPLPFGGIILFSAILLTILVVFLAMRSYFSHAAKLQEDDLRESKRAVADLEAQEAQFRAELEDLRKAESILIQRNGALEKELEQYK